MLLVGALLLTLTSFSLGWPFSGVQSACTQASNVEEYSDNFTDLYLVQIGLRLDKRQSNAELYVGNSTNATAGAILPVWQRRAHSELDSPAQVLREPQALHTLSHAHVQKHIQNALHLVGYFDGHLHYLAHIGAAFAAVFTMCTDDLLWFMPFAIHERKKTFCVWYVIFMELTVLVSCSLVGLVAWADQIWPDNPLQLIMELASTAFLAYYTVSLAVEWYYDSDSDDNNDEQKDVNQEREENVDQANDDVRKEGQEILPQTHKSRTRTVTELMLISVLGNLDNFTLYIALLFAGVFSGPELMFGAFLSACLVCAICVGLSWLDIIRRVFEYIPLWAILGVITIWSASQVIIEVTAAEQEI